MYLDEIVGLGGPDDLYEKPHHPFSRNIAP
jgi:hypothetical protein